jgi:hypothetical protein
VYTHKKLGTAHLGITMKLTAILLTGFAAVSLCHASTTVLSNMPNTETATGPLLTSYQWVAVGLTTSSTGVQFDSLTGFFTNPASFPLTIDGGIYSDSAGQPGSSLVAFVSQTIGAYVNTPESFTLETASSYILSPSTSYWFVVGDYGVGGGVAWDVDSATAGGTAPTAAPGYTFLGYQVTSDSGDSWYSEPDNPSIQIEVDQVAPEPTTAALLTLGGALLLARARRRKIAL